MKSVDELTRMKGLTEDLTSKELALSILRELNLPRLVGENYLKGFYLENKNILDELKYLPKSKRDLSRVILGAKVLKDLDELGHDAFKIIYRFKTRSDDDFIYSAVEKLVCRYMEYRLSETCQKYP